jgi:hypothetical protein
MLSASLTYQVTVTSLRYHSSFPLAPEKLYVMTGGVVSAAAAPPAPAGTASIITAAIA